MSVFAVAFGAMLAWQAASPVSPPVGSVVPVVGTGSGAGSVAMASPAETLGEHAVATEFRLPPLRDRPTDTLRAQLSGLQVMERATQLGVSAASSTEAWQSAQGRWKAAMQPVPAPVHVVVFSGSSASALNALLRQATVAAVSVSSAVLQLDVPIEIARAGVVLDLGSAHLQPTAAMPYLLRIEGAQGVTVQGGVLSGGRTGVLVSRSRDVALRGMTLDGLGGGGIVLVDTRDSLVRDNTLRHLHAAPVLLAGDTTGAVVTGNEIADNLGPSNWHAGVVLTDRPADLAADPGNLFSADGFWVRPQPMAERTHVPQNNVIAYNHIAGNSSSGVYSDGSVRNVIVGNRIEGNSKEGLCLDDGSSADVVAWNTFRGNGQRWGKSDADLRNDFVLSAGKLPDGTSAAKLPAVSLDNAAFNEVVFNEFNGNFGGGVKMVRTGLYNLVGLNLLVDNNEGHSERFHFFGIELGAASADAPSPELDFGPSRGNIVFGNTVRGTHYAGIFFAPGSDNNDVFDNSIFGAAQWAMESARPEANTTLNNFTNLHSRNVSAGLSPELAVDSGAIFDTPPAPPVSEPSPPAVPKAQAPLSP